MQYFLCIAFKGTSYHGWQKQQNAHTVQDELNGVLAHLFDRKEVYTLGCGRTDTGVHATCFYVGFQIDHAPFPDLKHRLNSMLPADIAVKAVHEVPEDYQVRFDATARTYEYHIHQSKNPFLEDRSYHFERALDLDAMNEASVLLKKYENFSSFCKTGSSNVTDICRVTEAEWTSQDDKLKLRIKADRFLRNMVRAVVGTLLPIGYGKYSPDHMRQVIESRDRNRAGTSAPPHGLFLVNVEYPYDLTK